MNETARTVHSYLDNRPRAAGIVVVVIVAVVVVVVVVVAVFVPF